MMEPEFMYWKNPSIGHYFEFKWPTPRHIIMKFHYIPDQKEDSKIFRSGKRGTIRTSYIQRVGFRIAWNPSRVALKAKIQMDNAFKIPKENDFQHRIIFIVKKKKNLCKHERFLKVSLSYIFFQETTEGCCPTKWEHNQRKKSQETG